MSITGSFRVDLNRVRSKIGEAVKVKAERITQKLVDSFVEDSPVYSGNFRASWNISEGFPIYRSELGGSPASILPAPSFNVKAKTLFPVFFITNGKPYARFLEYGGSNQAPLGIIRINIASLR